MAVEDFHSPAGQKNHLDLLGFTRKGFVLCVLARKPSYRKAGERQADRGGAGAEDTGNITHGCKAELQR